MNTEVLAPISKEEIDWVRSKHQDIHKSARRMLKDAFEIGQWFIDAEERSGRKKTRSWQMWLQATFPEMGMSTIYKYMKLAREKTFVEEQLHQTSHERRFGPTITGALGLLKNRDKQSNPLQLPPATLEEPLQILHDQLASYVYQTFQLKYLEDQIRFRIKNAKLGRRQIRQAIEYVTREHLEVREVVLKAFLG